MDLSRGEQFRIAFALESTNYGRGDQKPRRDACRHTGRPLSAVECDRSGIRSANIVQLIYTVVADTDADLVTDPQKVGLVHLIDRDVHHDLSPVLVER